MAEAITPALTYIFIGLTSTIALVIGVAASLLHYQHRKYAHIPGPTRDSFWLGNAPTIQRELAAGKILPQIFLDWSLKHGHTFVVYFAHRAIVFTCHQETVKELLVTGGHPRPKRTARLSSHVFGTRFFGNSLANETDVEKWKRRRSAMGPAFFREHLKNMVPEFNQGSDAMMEKLSAAADAGTPIAMAPLLSRVTLDIIAKVAFYQELDSVNDENVDFPKATSLVMKGLAKKVQDPLGRFKFYAERGWKKEVCEALLYLRKTGASWLEERRLAMERGQYVPEDILTHIIRIQEESKELSEEEVMDDILLLFVAGRETTAMHVSFTILELTRHPDIIRKLQEEVDTVIGSNACVSYEHLGQLKYCSMVLKESMRLYPPTAFLFRETMQDYVADGFLVPKNTTYFMSSFVSGRHPDLQDTPEVFDPERFADDSPNRPPVYTYMPFSMGPRICLGHNFAQMEAKIILAKLMQRFDLQLHPSQSFDIQQNTTIRPKDDVLCRVTHRS